jgi:hypothetical protein
MAYKGRKGVRHYTFLIRTKKLIRGVRYIGFTPRLFLRLDIPQLLFLSRMAITVREVLDDDLLRAVEIEAAAYADNPLSPVLFPGPFPAESRQQSVSHLMQTRNSDPSVRYLQAYDEASGQMVAFAKWSIYRTHEIAAGAQRPLRPFGPGTNSEACEAFFGTLASKKKQLMGDRPHFCEIASRL